MKAAPLEGTAPVAVPEARRGALVDFLALTKPRVNVLVLITTEWVLRKMYGML